MKKTKHHYLLFGLIGLAVAGTVAVLYQKSGKRFQEDLIKTMKKQTLSTKRTLNTIIEAAKF